MARILNIESATTVCSVCISDGDEIVASREVDGDYQHAEKLAVFVDEILEETGIPAMELDAVAVSLGPGSYTGLRIGTSLAKGICYAADIPLIAVPTLMQMCLHGSVQEYLKEFPNALLAPMLDARRMEVYSAVYTAGLEVLEPVRALILEASSFDGFLVEQPVLFFGNGSKKYKSLMEHENAVFIDHVQLSARQMALLAHRQFLNNSFEDLAYFEPKYLKDFIAAKPKRLV